MLIKIYEFLLYFSTCRIKEIQINGHAYKLYEQLATGKSTYSQIYKAREASSLQFQCLKIYSIKTEEVKKEIQQEIHYHKQLLHNNIIKYISSSASQDRNKIFIFTELVEPYTLETILQHDNQLPIQTIVVFLKDLTLPLFYLWQHRFVLNSLIPEKILTNRNGILKICEFKHITHLNESSKNFILNDINQVSYFPPELLLEGGFCTEKSDIFSLGCIGYRMITGISPYQFVANQVQDIKTYASILIKQSQKIEEYAKQYLLQRSNIPEQLSQMILKAIKINYEERLSCKDLLNNQLLDIQDDIVYQQDMQDIKQQLHVINVDNILIKGIQKINKSLSQISQQFNQQEKLNIDKDYLHEQVQILQQETQKNKIFQGNKLNDKNLLGFIKKYIIQYNEIFDQYIEYNQAFQINIQNSQSISQILNGQQTQLQMIESLIQSCYKWKISQIESEKIIQLITQFKQIQKEISQLLAIICIQNKKSILQSSNFNILINWIQNQIQLIQQQNIYNEDSEYILLCLLRFIMLLDQQQNDNLQKIFLNTIKLLLNWENKINKQQLITQNNKNIIQLFQNIQLFAITIQEILNQNKYKQIIKEQYIYEQYIQLISNYIDLLTNQQNLPFFAQNKLFTEQQYCLKGLLQSLYKITRIDQCQPNQVDITYIKSINWSEEFNEENKILISLILINAAFKEQLEDINSLQRKQQIQKTMDQYLLKNFQFITTIITKKPLQFKLIGILTILLSTVLIVDPFTPLIYKNPLNLKNHRIFRYTIKQNSDFLRKIDVLLATLCQFPNEYKKLGYQSSAFLILIFQFIIDVGIGASKHFLLNQNYLNLKYYNKCFTIFQFLQTLVQQKFSLQNEIITLLQVQSMEQIGCALTNTCYEISDKNIDNFTNQDFIQLLNCVINGYQYLLYNMSENTIVQSNLYIQQQGDKNITTNGLLYSIMNLLKCPIFPKLDQEQILYKGINQFRIQLLNLLQQTYTTCFALRKTQQNILQVLQKSILRQTCSQTMFTELLLYNQYQPYLINILTIGYKVSGNQYTISQQNQHLTLIIQLIKSEKYNLLKQLYKCLAEMINSNQYLAIDKNVLQQVDNAIQNYNVSYSFIEAFCQQIIEAFQARLSGNQNSITNLLTNQKIEEINQLFDNLIQLLQLLLEDSIENNIDKITSAKIVEKLLIYVVSNNQDVLQLNKLDILNFSKQSVDIIKSSEKIEIYQISLLNSLVVISQFLKQNIQEQQLKNITTDLYNILPQDQKFKAEQILNGQTQLLLFQ